MTGLQEYGSATGGLLGGDRELSGCSACRSFRTPASMVHPLGLLQEIDGGETLVAVKFDIDEPSLERIRRTAQVNGPLLEDPDRVAARVLQESARLVGTEFRQRARPIGQSDREAGIWSVNRRGGERIVIRGSRSLSLGYGD